MSGRVAIPLAEAAALVAELLDLLRPACQRTEVAGSIRRQRPTVHDLEIVCQPLVFEQTELDLFGEVASSRRVNLLDERCAELELLGLLTQRLDVNGRPRWGERYKAAVYRDVPLDLFVVRPPVFWGVILTLRTGSAAFSKRLVTPREVGGWLPPGYQVERGRLLLHGVPVPTPREEDLFAAIGQPWVSPEQREC